MRLQHKVLKTIAQGQCGEGMYQEQVWCVQYRDRKPSGKSSDLVEQLSLGLRTWAS
jgi:hypothetical protein